MLGDFSSVLAMLLGCGLDSFLGLATPKLMVPGEFKVRAGSVEQRGEQGQQTGLWRRKMNGYHAFLPLSFHFLAHKIQIVIIMTSQSCCED